MLREIGIIKNKTTSDSGRKRPLRRGLLMNEIHGEPELFSELNDALSRVNEVLSNVNDFYIGLETFTKNLMDKYGISEEELALEIETMRGTSKKVGEGEVSKM
jgi:hypothetical protein